jgi:uncharacterized protein YgiM (DUF1202 family)
MTLRSVFHSLILSLILSVGLVQTQIVFAGEETFPFRGEAVMDQVNVRAGQSTNFEGLCKLKKGEEVIALEKGYGWYKIQLPKAANCYVNKEYIQFLGQNAGGVLGDHINIRAGAGTHYTVLGQLMKGEQIFIEEDLKEWYRIQPVLGSYGWVAEEYLAFKSNDVKEYEDAMAAKTSADLELSKLKEPLKEGEQAAEDIKDTKDIKNTKDTKDTKDTSDIKSIKNTKETVDEEPETFFAVGYVEAYEDDENDGIYYKITSGGRPVCYVQGMNEMLGRFKNLRVSVEGTVNKALQSKYAYPVIIVSTIRLML